MHFDVFFFIKVDTTRRILPENIPGSKENVDPNAKRQHSEGIQCCYYKCTNRVYMNNGQRSPFNIFKVLLENPLKSSWCNRMGKVDGKDGFVVTKHTKVCNEHFSSNDMLKVPGGKRWRLKDGAIPLKAGQPFVKNIKRKPPTMRT